MAARNRCAGSCGGCCMTRRDPVTTADYRDLMSETDWQTWVVSTARARGWLVAHLRDSRGQDANGLPDLVLARGGLVILAELKTERGAIRESQRPWLAASGNHVWRPSDRARVEAVL